MIGALGVRIKIKVLRWILMSAYSIPLKMMSTNKEMTSSFLSRLQENTTARVRHKTSLQINWKSSRVSMSLPNMQQTLSYIPLFRLYVDNTVHVYFFINISSLFVFLVAIC